MTYQRKSGILLHPTSLPSNFGIGDLGKPAYEFVDFLSKSGQKIWQILPLGPTGYEHSPYTMNFSAFAGNPLMISLEMLAEEGLLKPDELIPLQGENINPNRVNFDQVIPYKTKYLKQAYQEFKKSLLNNIEFEEFVEKYANWLEDYCLFMAIFEANNYLPWNQWEKSLARREKDALQKQREELKESILYHKFLQYKFFQQWTKLRKYTNEKDIQIIGDVSIYVCHNSAEVWGNPDIFKLNPETLESAYIAGVPPDFFSATGQVWGNPVYNWEVLEKTEFAWWIERFRATLEYVDLVRIDHFRGFEAYWEIPGGEETAINGKWVKAPGMEFFKTMETKLGKLPVLAEDLGIITPPVEELRNTFDFPGMKILQFAFGDDSNNPYLPHNYIRNCLVYTGTHDNDTTIGWWEKSDDKQKEFVAKYLGYSSFDEVKAINWDLIRLALNSVAETAILPLQDILDLDNNSRMNDPSITPGNWRWRYQSNDLLTPELAEKLLQLTRIYNR